MGIHLFFLTIARLFKQIKKFLKWKLAAASLKQAGIYSNRRALVLNRRVHVFISWHGNNNQRNNNGKKSFNKSNDSY